MYDEARELKQKIKQGLAREAYRRKMVTTDQFAQLMELQRGR